MPHQLALFEDPPLWRQIVLLDMNSMLHRAYHTLGRTLLTNGTSFGMLKMILGMSRQFKMCDGMIAVWDGIHARKHMQKIYPLYKANRGSPDEEFNEQRGLVYLFLAHLGISQVTVNHLEADRLIGQYARLFNDRSLRVVVISEDQDFFQLLNSLTMIYRQNNFFTVSSLKEFPKYQGLSPRQVLYVRALMGDTADNVAGVGGIGEVKAAKMVLGRYKVSDFKSVLTPAQQERFRINLKLMRLRMPLYDNEVKEIIDHLSWEKPSPKKLNELVVKLKFRSFVNVEKMMEPLLEINRRWHTTLQELRSGS